VLVEVDYEVDSQQLLLRKMQLYRTVTTALPLQVNVQDYFRGNKCVFVYTANSTIAQRIFRLFSRFTISTTSQQHLRIRSVDLRIEEDGAETGVSVTSTQSAQRRAMVCIRSTSSLGPVLTSL
jgi:hypothetical protein